MVKKQEKVKTKNKKTVKKETKVNTKKVGLFKKIGNWFKSVFKEMSKVKWPSKKEMVKYSIATIVFVIFFALLFYAVELLMAFLKTLI